MDPDVTDALYSACGINYRSAQGSQTPKERVVARLRVRILAFLRELPEHMTIKELKEELEDEGTRAGDT
jgi:hypothetical protein